MTVIKESDKLGDYFMLLCSPGEVGILLHGLDFTVRAFAAQGERLEESEMQLIEHMKEEISGAVGSTQDDD